MAPSRKQCLYVSMVILALLAGSMDRRMQQHLHELSLTVKSALRLSLLNLLEGMEYAAARERARAEETQALQYQKAAEEYEHKANQDALYSTRQRHRGEYLERLGQMEEAEAIRHASLAQRDDAERLAMLHNISQLEKDENETQTALREIHKGACAWKLVSPICETVGGATELQQRANADSVEIHNDWKEATRLGHEQVMQKMVTDMLTAKSSRYNQSAHDLWKMADYWDAKAQADYQQAQEDNSTAAVLWQKASRDEQIMERDKKVEYKVDVLVERLMQRAETEKAAAYWCAVLAIICAATSLVFFGGKVIPKAHGAVLALEETKDASNLAYMAVHVLIFLVVVGVAGHYLVQIDHYTSVQRAVILIWFAIVASLGQTISLHALPWALQQVSIEDPSADILAFCVEMGTRYVVFFAMFLLEVLHVWLALGRGLFQESVVNFCAGWFFRLVVLAAIVAYGWYVEGPRRAHEFTHVDETSTLLSGSTSAWPENQSILLSSSEGNSEATPLRKSDVMSWGTTIDLAIGGGCGESASTAAEEVAATSSSSTNGALLQDLRKLILPLEILFVACMLAVLRNALHTVWIAQATWIQCGVLVCAIGLLLVAFWFTHEACCEQTWTTSFSPSSSSSFKSGGKNDDVTSSLRLRPKFEMVQV